MSGHLNLSVRSTLPCLTMAQHLGNAPFKLRGLISPEGRWIPSFPDSFAARKPLAEPDSVGHSFQPTQLVIGEKGSVRIHTGGRGSGTACLRFQWQHSAAQAECSWGEPWCLDSGTVKALALQDPSSAMWFGPLL